jgi:hypothetical protein
MAARSLRLLGIATMRPFSLAKRRKRAIFYSNKINNFRFKQLFSGNMRGRCRSREKPNFSAQKRHEALASLRRQRWRHALRDKWYVERIAQNGSETHWRAERADLFEVLEDLQTAQQAGEYFRFLAPADATDEELDILLERGATPTFPPLTVAA